MTSQHRIGLRVEPLLGGSFTQLTLHGPVSTTPTRRQLGRLISLLSLWNGYPLDVVLSVDKASAGWLEIWCDALRGVPNRHLEVTFKTSLRRQDETEK